MNKLYLVGALSVYALTCNAHAGLITFEDLSGVPVGTVVSNQYLVSDGVTFTSNPVLGDVGNTLEGWILDSGANDAFAPGEGGTIGNLFITDVVGGNPTGTSTLVVEYVSEVGGLSFDLIDIDDSESYVIEVFDNLDNLLSTRSITDGDAQTGDGVVTRIGISAEGIRKLVVTGTKTSGSGFGLGFDNFNTSTVPIPAAVWLFGSGLIGLIGVARRKKT